MKDKRFIIGAVVLLILVGLTIWGFSKAKPQSNSQVQGTSTASAAFFSDSSPVMYFYSDGCHWCQEQKKVLDELAKEGFRVKAMDVGKNPDYWQKYQVQGTPTFIAENGERLEGYNKADTLKPWLESHGGRTDEPKN